MSCAGLRLSSVLPTPSDKIADQRETEKSTSCFPPGHFKKDTPPAPVNNTAQHSTADEVSSCIGTIGTIRNHQRPSRSPEITREDKLSRHSEQNNLDLEEGHHSCSDTSPNSQWTELY
ncbi:hypothetical protein WMY93_028141 [Mugilogobius chulae]|uniref:Uncharacterized protein n=1 Tax=Mugilogobius chulae TaxID=88201 RepID=A0AAW0MS40_9GOBI